MVKQPRQKEQEHTGNTATRYSVQINAVFSLKFRLQFGYNGAILMTKAWTFTQKDDHLWRDDLLVARLSRAA